MQFFKKTLLSSVIMLSATQFAFAQSTALIPDFSNKIDFAVLDQNQDEAIDMDELKTFIQNKYGSMIKRQFERLDRGWNEFITFEEFSAITPYADEDIMLALFEKHHGGDAVLSYDEFRSLRTQQILDSFTAWSFWQRDLYDKSKTLNQREYNSQVLLTTQEEVEQNLKKWNAFKSKHQKYGFKYSVRVACECSPTNWLEILEKNGEVKVKISGDIRPEGPVLVSPEGELVPSPKPEDKWVDISEIKSEPLKFGYDTKLSYITIDELFNKAAGSFTTFHPKYGYPMVIDTESINLRLSDSGAIYEVNGFEVLKKENMTSKTAQALFEKKYPSLSYSFTYKLNNVGKKSTYFVKVQSGVISSVRKKIAGEREQAKLSQGITIHDAFEHIGMLEQDGSLKKVSYHKTKGFPRKVVFIDNNTNKRVSYRISNVKKLTD